MNIELLNKVADAIENEPHLYDQSEWGTCATPRCVAGWICHLTLSWPLNPQATPSRAAAKKLGNSLGDCDRLFTSETWPQHWFVTAKCDLPDPGKCDLSDPDHPYAVPSAKDAAAILRAMADDGEIWL